MPNDDDGDLKSLKALAEEEKLKRFICVCLESRRRVVVENLPDQPTVTVALPMLDISRPRGPYDSSLPS